MLVSDEQAKRMICPEAHEDPVVLNGAIYRAPFAKCHGSGCMAWRWAGYWSKEHDAPMVNPVDYNGERRNRVGFCGKAGPARC